MLGVKKKSTSTEIRTFDFPTTKLSTLLHPNYDMTLLELYNQVDDDHEELMRSPCVSMGNGHSNLTIVLCSCTDSKLIREKYCIIFLSSWPYSISLHRAIPYAQA